MVPDRKYSSPVRSTSALAGTHLRAAMILPNFGGVPLQTYFSSVGLRRAEGCCVANLNISPLLCTGGREMPICGCPRCYRHQDRLFQRYERRHTGQNVRCPVSLGKAVVTLLIIKALCSSLTGCTSIQGFHSICWLCGRRTLEVYIELPLLQRRVLEKYGVVDILVNNAGSFGPMDL